MFGFSRRNPRDPVNDAVHRAASKALLTATPASAYLCTPVGGFETIGCSPTFTPLIRWGIFNPIGPTMYSLLLVPCPGFTEQLLFLRVLNPFSTSGIVFGLLPDAVCHDMGRLEPTLRRLFERNGCDDFPLMPSLPTHIPIIPESPVSLSTTKSLILAAARKASDVSNVTALSDEIERHWGDPWQGTKVEFPRVLAEFTSWSSHKLRRGQPTNDQLNRWWALVSNKDHVRSETSQMQAAWQGAIHFSKGSYH